MPISIERKMQRVPLIHDRGVDTGWVEALVYEGLVSVHPCLKYPGAGKWTVTLAKSGQGLLHFDTQREAQDFAVELIKSNIPLGFYHYMECPGELKARLTAFVQQWGAERHWKYVDQVPGGGLYGPDGRKLT
jgi:hypothetical protein